MTGPDLPWLGDAVQVLAMAAVIVAAWWVRRPAATLMLWAARRRHTDAPVWWAHRPLVTALIDAGVLRPRDGEQLNLSYWGAPRPDHAGTTVKVALPQARTLSDVLARREPLAAALRIPVASLEVTQDDDDPAHVITLRVSAAVASETPATVTTAARTLWTDPVRIGHDKRGQPVYLATVEANDLIAGRPGAGKTTLARIMLGHYLLDPSTTVYGVDGKGSRRDYQAAAPLCARFVYGTDEDAVSDTLALLSEVLDLVRARNASGDADHPGVLVLLEELQDVRTAADRAERARLDDVLGRIVRMGRAVAVHVIVSTQRPSIEDLPSGIRNLLSQSVALMLRPGDATLVLGSTPTLDLPRRRGQALLATAAGVRSVELDRLDEAAWRALCRRAASMRDSDAPSRGSDAPEGRSDAPPDPLLGAVLDVLIDADPTGIPAATLHAALPSWALDLVPTPRELGIELRRWPTTVERVYRGKSRVWRASEQCRSSVGALSVTPATDCRKALFRAQTPASDSAAPETARGGSTPGP